MQRLKLLLSLAIIAPFALSASATKAQPVACPAGFPCSIQFDSAEVQKVPQLMKFQSRVSQARLPLGDAIFQSVVVKVQRGDDVLCREEFSNVSVQNSVLNLEIGRAINCDLSNVIAENTELEFRVCLGGDDGCLRPLDLGVTPYAFKADFSDVANKANRCNVAAVSNYAKRVTADRDISIRDALGTGFFDFYTHPAGVDVADLGFGDVYAQRYDNSGFIAWSPVQAERAMTVHIVGAVDDRLKNLDAFVVSAADTELRGNVKAADAVFSGDLNVSGDATVDGALMVGLGPALGQLTLDVNGNSQLRGDVQIAGTLDITTLRKGGQVVDLDQFVQTTPKFSNDGVNLYYSDGNVRIGPNSANANTSIGKTLDVLGDIGLTGDIYKNSTKMALWIDDSGSARYESSVTVGQNLNVGNTLVSNDIRVDRNMYFGSQEVALWTKGTSGLARYSGDVVATGNLTVGSLNGPVGVSFVSNNAAIFMDQLRAESHVSVAKNFYVGQNSTLNGDLAAPNNTRGNCAWEQKAYEAIVSDNRSNPDFPSEGICGGHRFLAGLKFGDRGGEKNVDFFYFYCCDL